MKTGFRRAWLMGGCLTLLALLGGCGRAREPGRHYDDKNGFSIRVPGDWQVREGLMGSAVAALRPAGPGEAWVENMNVMVDAIPSGTTATDYWAAAQKPMAKMFANYAVRECGDEVVDGRPAHWSVYSHRMGTMDLEVLVYAVTQGPRGYVITCTAANGRLAHYRTQFQEICRSFRVE